MGLAADFEQVLDALPSDWTDLEVDLRIDDESRYVDTAVALSRSTPGPTRRRTGTGACWSPKLRPRRRAPRRLLGVLETPRRGRRRRRASCGARGARGPRRGRADVGRPESVREEFRQRRASSSGRDRHRIVAVAPDLLLGSKVEAMLSAAGHEVDPSRSLAEAPLDGRGAASSPTSTPRTPGARRARGPGARLLLARRGRDPRARREAAGVDWWSCRARGWPRAAGAGRALLNG